ncbi:alkene reductase [Sphingobium sp. HBC34]|uniref:Alkene reductase n=1 Tax=Sphingobium cyanobacteriorum TaxID=3063954 RepID=A0ABT8ZQF7_9SPHN|nr:alkene reductase [Sphingobium sp. HBC34]MDO7836421.1 alkene reductase [Sphingobium sp. HBC34]
MTEQGSIFDGFEHRGVRYANRVAFSPLTRARASANGVPDHLQATYYRQRAGAGLQIAEATAVLPEGHGGIWTPGLYDQAQVDGWRLTTDAVHAAGGKIYAQLWHAGRLSHSSFHPDGLPPASPAAIAAQGQVHIAQGRVDYEVPRALRASEIDTIVLAFERAARNAMNAGFDGVEIHAAHGYLLDSFLRDAINDRTDDYGGSLENRARFLVAVLRRVVAAIGPDKVAVRLSPDTQAGGMRDSDPQATFNYVIDQMNALDIAWLDLVEGNNLVSRDIADGIDVAALVVRFKGAVILNHGYTLDMANAAIGSGAADMIAFGRPFIANPDLVERFRHGYPLAEGSRSTWYGGGAEGYSDFPTYRSNPTETAGN